MTWLRPSARGLGRPLLLLSHAGGGAGSFARWPALFPPSVAVVRAQLPGREDRAAEAPLHDVDDVVAGLLPDLLRAGRAPAIYGHSMGALVGFELARALAREGRRPAHLFVSGRRAPHRPARRAPIHGLPDDDFLGALVAMGGLPDPAALGAPFRRHFLPLIAADLALCENWTMRPGPPLSCPVTAFVGVGDPVVDADEVEAWAAETTGPFAVHHHPGDHFFHQRHRVAIAATITAALSEPEEDDDRAAPAPRRAASRGPG